MNLRRILLHITIAVGCTLSLAVIGCQPKRVSDQALTTDIQAKLYADPSTRTASVKVSVSDGVVTLTGDAPSSDVELQVVNIANSAPGTKSVNNQMQMVAASTAPPLPPPDNAPAPAPTPAQAAAPTAQNAPPPPPGPLPAAPAPAKPVRVTVPAGTELGIQMIDGISSKTNTAGQTFRASLSTPVVVNGHVVLPTGAGATVLLAEAKGAGRIKGSSSLEVRVIRIQHAGQTYDVDTSVHDEQGKGRGKESAVRSGIGAAAGAVIGALAGGGKGAAIGSIAGGGAGAGIQLATHGQQLHIPSEARLTFRLEAPVLITLHHER